MIDKTHITSPKSSKSAITAFIDKASKSMTQSPSYASQQGRLVFTIDATASRHATWDMAAQIQTDMFLEAAKLGDLEIQLAYYRGHHEFTSSPWLGDGLNLAKIMRHVYCVGGMTQIGRVLNHALVETQKQKIHAVVFIGDSVEEYPKALYTLAGQLGLYGVPAFMFQEGLDPVAQSIFQQIARLSNGAYCHFDPGSATQLKDLLCAVTRYAVGGRKALEQYTLNNQLTQRLTQQLF